MKSKNDRFLGNCFLQITFELKELGQNKWYHRVSLVNSVRTIYLMTLKGHFQNLTSGQGHVVTQYDPGGSNFIWVDAYWRGKHIGAIFSSLSSLYQKLLAKNLCDPVVTSGDLVGGHWTTTAHGSSRIASYDMILRKLEWSDMYSWNKKHLNISPLTYNGEGHVINLTLGQGLKIPRYTNCWVWWPHPILKVVKWSITNCGCGMISNYFWGWVTWPDLGQWPDLWSGRNFYTTCQIDQGTGTENLAALRAAVFTLS